MSLRRLVSLVFTLLLAFVVVLPAAAGGWAVITLDEWPSNVTAGQPLKIGFTVRQHGITPMGGLEPTVIAQLPSGEKFVVEAAQEGEPGHYAATLTFPKEGTWDWSIQAFTMDQPMPALAVAAPGAETTRQPVKPESQISSIPVLLILRILALGIALAAFVFVLRQRSRFAAVLGTVCLLIGLGTFLPRAATLQVEAQSKSASAPAAQIEVGRQLFIAKGCITCHFNDRAANRSEYWTIDMGAPDLSNYSSHPDILRIRLKDPAAAKSDTKMPDLGLKKEEIEALIVFLNSK